MVGRIKTSRTKSLLLLLTVAIGIGLNFLGRLLNSIFGLPLYLDNIGTILAAALGFASFAAFPHSCQRYA